MAPLLVDISTGDGQVAVEISGRGPNVLCLHGLSANRCSWRPVAARLAHRFRFHIPDLLSRGASTPRPDLRYGLADDLDRLRELVGELGIAPALIAGHSTGAALALGLAAGDHRILGLLLANPVTPWTRRPASLDILRAGLMRRAAAGIFRPLRRPLAKRVLARVYGPGRHPTADSVEAYSAPYAEPGRALALMRILADWRPAELAAYLPKRTVAATVLAGDHDPRIDVESADRLARLLGAPLLRVPDGGHALPEEVPETVAGALSELAERCLPRSGTEDDVDQE